MAELDALRRSQQDFEAAGATLLALSPELPEESRQLIQDRKIGFDILRDAGNAYLATLGLVHTLPEELRTIYGGFGIDLPRSNGEASWTLPLPARYIIDPSGLVRYARVHPDYTERPEVTETLEALGQAG